MEDDDLIFVVDDKHPQGWIELRLQRTPQRRVQTGMRQEVNKLFVKNRHALIVENGSCGP
jgi:hypothetical protein